MTNKRGIVEFNDNMPNVVGSQLEADKAAAARFKSRDGLSVVPYPRGVFSEFPSSTPKWLGQRGDKTYDYRETMARMFILLNANERSRFLASVDASHRGGGMGDNGEARTLAAVLAGDTKTEGGTGYIDFLLQRAGHQFQEKSAIVETLADNYVMYYFGAAAEPFHYSGTVLNTYEDDQGINMLRLYRDVLRGTQLARRRKLVRLRYNGMIVAGSMMNLTLDLTAETESAMSFSFQIMPKTVQILPNPSFGVVSLKTPFEVDSFFLDDRDTPTQTRAASPLAAPTTAAQVLNGSAAPSEVTGEAEDAGGV